MTNNSSMNRICMLDFLPDVKIPVLHISLFSAKSGQAPYRKVPCFTNKVLEWYKHVLQISQFSLMTRSELRFQLITYTVPQNCLSLFTIHQNSLFPYVQLTGGWAFSFFVEGSHLGKIRLGTNVTRWNDILLFVVVVDVIVIFRLIRIQWLVYPLTLSFIPDWYYVISPKYKYLIE